MVLKLEQVVPWGRSLTEYVRMFHLTTDDLNLKIIDCASGPASFNAEMTNLGHKVISCDPIYQFSATEIEQRIQLTYPQIINGVTASLDDYVWREIANPTQLGAVRMATMQKFLVDFSLGLQQKRYLNYGLPTLPFKDNQFDLALCSHFLFSYSNHFSATFHIESIVEMCRVSQQVRIFPLLDISGVISSQLAPVMSELKTRGYQVEIKQVDYEFQKGGNQMLVVEL